MASSLAGKHYIVTGGASGIGLATVHRLLRASATVHVIDWMPKFPSYSTDIGSLHLYPSIDVGSRQYIAETFETIFSRSPAIHGLVNAAGISPSGDYSMTGNGWGIEKDTTYDHVMDVNVRGTCNTTTELLRHVLARKKIIEPKLSVVNIGSLASFNVYATMATYCASKHAILGLTRTWATEYGRTGHRFNLVAPGLIATPLGLHAMKTDDERGRANKSAVDNCALGRYGQPDEITGPILFLLGRVMTHHSSPAR